MKLLVVKTNKGLLPCYNSDYEKYSKIPMDEKFEITYVKSRNYKFHKKYFALMSLAFENQSRFLDMNLMRTSITITAGFYTEILNLKTGEVHPIADSISFAKMDEIEFNDLYEKTKNVISEWLGITNKTIDEEIQQYY